MTIGDPNHRKLPWNFDVSMTAAKKNLNDEHSRGGWIDDGIAHDCDYNQAEVRDSVHDALARNECNVNPRMIEGSGERGVYF